MQVASLEPCKELYELSGWDSTRDSWQAYTHEVKGKNYDRWSLRTPKKSSPTTKQSIPAYDLGYLLRKLPGHITLTSTTWDDIHTEKVEGQELEYQAVACYQSNVKGLLIQKTADTPEDAAAKLAIELFKEGVLK